VLKPPPGFALVELDWSAQEVAIMGALGGDENMMADYRNGDCHTAFALRAALIDDDDDEETRAEVRNKQAKPVVLGANYGMSPYGIRGKTKRSLDWCRHIYHQHRVIYGTFHTWLDDMVVTARFDQKMISAHGWPLQVHSGTRDRTLMNYLAQASGADAMRVAAIAATEAGHAVCCSVHDSFKILTPLERLDRTVKEMGEIMRMAGAAVTGVLEIPAEVKSIVRSPQRLADTWTAKDRGLRTWVEIQARLDSGELEKASDGEGNEDEKAAAAS
jgi:DNA polymerase I-like protein with 3'-5' exonuclease and polymerase domains